MLNWGIAGAGNIANRVGADFQYIHNGHLNAIASRSLPKATQFADQFNVPHIFKSYEEMALSKEIDAVYIATIHPYHYPIAQLFLEHGKHVLVEKPAVIHTAQWKSLVQLAKDNHCFLMEAMKFVCFPAYRKLKQYLQDTRMQIDHIQACFGNDHTFDPTWHLFDKKLAGGLNMMSDVIEHGYLLIC